MLTELVVVGKVLVYKVESKKVVLAKRTPVKLQTIQPASSKTTTTKKKEKKAMKKTVALKPKK